MPQNATFFDACPHLAIRGDFSHSMPRDSKVPSGFSCALIDAGKPCPYRGGCVVAKSHKTGRPVGASRR